MSTLIDVKQIIYALERQAAALDAQAEQLLRRHDYSAEFPAADADRMREAIALLSATPIPGFHVPAGVCPHLADCLRKGCNQYLDGAPCATGRVYNLDNREEGQ